MGQETCRDLMDKLEQEQRLSMGEFVNLITEHTDLDSQYLFKKANRVRELYFGRAVYIRGLIEFTNFCKNGCYYCGIRHSNHKAPRYRLSPEEILECCEKGYDLGFRTFVLQGGEDGYFTDERLTGIISSIKAQFPDCALTLSIGEKPKESYEAYFRAGADRYLLRHETADAEHYRKLHPGKLTLEHRKQCLHDLKEIGFQVGAGFMVGSPGQRAEHLAKDLLFLKELEPQMVGIGPFLSHQDTPFRHCGNGSLEQTLFMLGLVRLMLPAVLLPATTALGTLHPQGRELGIGAGANVVMPNLSPQNVRKKYMLYDNKISTGLEAAESVKDLKERMEKIGYEVVTSRGDWMGHPISEKKEEQHVSCKITKGRGIY